MSDAALSKWVCREVLLRREAIIDSQDDPKGAELSKRAWDEIGTLAMIRFGSSITVDDLKRLWIQDSKEFIDNLVVDEAECSPRSSSSRLDQGIEEISVKVESPEEEEDLFLPTKKRKINDVISRNLPPCHAYKVIVREVLRRSSLLIDKSNSKSRTPQANHARWRAWQEIRAIVHNECTRDMPVEQIQIIWRHQKQKIPSEMVEQAILNPNCIDDQAVDAIFKYYEEKEKWILDPLKRESSDITAVLKDILPSAEINLGRDKELYEAKPLPSPLQVQPTQSLHHLLSPIITITKPTVSPPAEPEPTSVSISSIEDSIASVVRNSSADERKTMMVENLIKAHTNFLEQTMKLQKKQMEVLENFNKTVQMLLED